MNRTKGKSVDHAGGPEPEYLRPVNMWSHTNGGL